MGAFGEAPESPPDAMDLISSDFSEFEHRSLAVGKAPADTPKTFDQVPILPKSYKYL
jgi:hypothetical protein